MPLSIFGIRHHGPGSARSLGQALTGLQPDAILVEGPPDAADVLPLLAHPEMRPPVALLVYVPNQPQRAVYYPFAVFSPEWQAIHYGLTHNIPTRFMDLSQTHQLAAEPPAPEQPEAQPTPEPSPSAEDSPQSAIPNQQSTIHQDPLGWLALAAGYSDGERWWEHMVEQRRDSAGLFAAVLEAMTALREAEGMEPQNEREAQREAFMRQTLRAAQKEGYERIAVVCGAWHAPALAPERWPRAKSDAELLKGLPKIKVQATWVPWTNGRLTYASGYGAGIESPGWYAHIWESTDRIAERWLARVARLLREQDLDASAASVIEAVRLAEALAALRDRPLPGLPELNEATQAVLCFGGDLPMKLIAEKLIVGETLGRVPDETPAVPLQRDIQREQKRLRLPPEASHRDLDLDLRQPFDLDRSRLLHRLRLLDIPWGEQQRARVKISTFHELWRIQWQPEFAVKIIDASRWGNTAAEAAAAFTRDAADRARDLPALTALLDRAMLADLPDVIPHVMARVQAEAALASDVAHLMDSLPSLANILRYGNVRQTDASLIQPVVDGMVARLCIGLPGACASLNDEAAAEMHDRMVNAHEAIVLLQNAEHLAQWNKVLTHLADQGGLHGLVAGRCCRLLLDQGLFKSDDVVRRMRLAFSPGVEPAQSAAWVEGLLKGSGLLLLHDDALWAVLDAWVTDLPEEAFKNLLPLLRRTFSTFTPPERRQMGERVAGQGGFPKSPDSNLNFDEQRADQVLELIGKILG